MYAQKRTKGLNLIGGVGTPSFRSRGGKNRRNDARKDALVVKGQGYLKKKKKDTGEEREAYLKNPDSRRLNSVGDKKRQEKKVFPLQGCQHPEKCPPNKDKTGQKGLKFPSTRGGVRMSWERPSGQKEGDEHFPVERRGTKEKKVRRNPLRSGQGTAPRKHGAKFRKNWSSRFTREKIPIIVLNRGGGTVDT